MRLLKHILLGLGIAIVLVVLGFVVWAQTPFQAAPEALSALDSDLNVTVTIDQYITFQPINTEPTTAFVFYPGGRVDYRAYAAPLRQIAEQGYLVILLPVRLNLAFFEVDAAGKAMADFPQIQNWVIGGHSLGGVAASLYASETENIAGIVFWASYPASDELKNMDVKVLSVYGTLDMGGMDAFDASRARLPADTEFVIINGGNHGQFGDYGFQPGDNEATITRLDQQSEVVDATVGFLDEINQ